LKKKFEKMSFDEIVKHISDTYIDVDALRHSPNECLICKEYYRILKKYDFIGLCKRWDYDD